MTLEEGILHAEKVYEEKLDERSYALEFHDNEEAEECQKCAEEQRQLADWLRELQETRKERDYWQEKAHSYEQTIFKLTDAISKQPEIIRCKDCENWDTTWQNDFAPNYHYCPMMDGTYSGDFYCAKSERRTDATD